jgi:hypothetical protein
MERQRHRAARVAKAAAGAGRIINVQRATCDVQHACHMQQALCNRRRAACSMQRATCSMQHKTYMQHANTHQHAACIMEHATCNMQHAAIGVQRATCNALQRATCSTHLATRNILFLATCNLRCVSRADAVPHAVERPIRGGNRCARRVRSRQAPVARPVSAPSTLSISSTRIPPVPGQSHGAIASTPM